MDRSKGEFVLDNPLFSPTEVSQEKCWDGNKETESTRQLAARSMPGHTGSNFASCELAVLSPKTLKSSEMASPETSRKVRDSSGTKAGNVVQFDEESQDMEEFRTRLRKFMEQEVEAACNESTGHISSPIIIKYGGVASYHPVYSPFAPRPRFLRLGGDKGRPVQDSPEVKRSEEEEIKEDMPQNKHSSFGGDEDAIAAESRPDELAQTAGLDDKRNESISSSSAEPAAGHTEGLRSVETDHKMVVNCLNLKGTGCHFRLRKRVPGILTVSIFLVFCFSLCTAIHVTGHSCSTNSTVTENRGVYSIGSLQSFRSFEKPLNHIPNLTGFQKYFKSFEKPSLAAMKSIFNLDGLKESSSFRKISDFGLLSFHSERFNSYFRSVGGYFTMELFKKLKSMDLLASMMNVTAAEVPRFYNFFDSERVVDTDPRNPRTEIHGTNVGKFEKPAPRAPSNRPGHENFEQIVLFLIIGMDICPREDSMNTCPILETLGIELDRDYNDFHNEDRSVLVLIQQHESIEIIQEQANSTHAENHSSPKLDRIFAEDQENRLWASNEISEISLSSPEQTEIQTNLEDLYNINGSSEVPFIELIPHEFWWLIWESLLLGVSLVFMLLILRGLIPRSKFPSGPYSLQTSKRMTQTTMESSKSPGFGSFTDYVDIPVSSKGSRSKELKTTPVRRSMRIRNERFSPLRHAPTFTIPSQ